jgi:MGT family glycosyltransferase
MTHFGIICPAANGHLNPMTALGRELQRRGHRVTIVSILDAQSNALAAGLEFRSFAESELPMGMTKQSLAQLGQLNGLAAFRYTANMFKESATLLLQYAPQVVREAGIDALLVDESTLMGGSVAEFLQIPFVTVSCALMLYREEVVPPFFTPWSYQLAWWAILRNRFGYSLLNRISQPILDVINKYRQQWNLPVYSRALEFHSKLAMLSQQPAEFEFPRRELPPWFHFTGPYSDSTGREKVDFPFEKLTGQPLIYASMGTIQNRIQYVFHLIAKACEELDAQLVISLGGAFAPEELPKLPGNPLIVKYAPQLELLQKTTLTITHAGMNTTLESLSNGVPMVAIPIANDQPGVAARIAWTGTGEFIPLSRLSVPKLRAAIHQVLTQDSYKQNALRLQEAIRRAGGVSRAADVVEQAISTGKPVLCSAN